MKNGFEHFKDGIQKEDFEKLGDSIKESAGHVGKGISDAFEKLTHKDK